ncbi:MAG TPA: SURF1 family protein [Nevskiaceae bacterium]
MLLTVAGVAVFCALGVWQVHRASYKQTVLVRFHRAADASLVPLATAVADPHRGDYPHVRVRGQLDGHRTYLLDDQMRDNMLGVMVFVPFRPSGAHTSVLVNLGFLPNRGPDATRLPALPPIPAGTVTLTGIYAPPPPPGLKLGGNPLIHETTWPKLVTWISTRQIADDLHTSILPHVLLLDPDPHSAYLRIWNANISMTPSRHMAYAFQWFTFAFVTVLVFLVLHRVKRERGRAVR